VAGSGTYHPATPARILAHGIVKGWLWLRVALARSTIGTLALAGRAALAARDVFAMAVSKDPAANGAQRYLSVSFHRVGETQGVPGRFHPRVR
jgi:hypothetical protein